MSIKVKNKTCIICKRERPWFSKKTCRSCYLKAHNKPILSKSTIKKISDKHRERLKKYQELRDQYFLEHPTCEFPGCTSKRIQLHHRAGRLGQKLYEDFMSCCSTHHEYIHMNPTESYENGWLISTLKQNND